ncbi:cytochrome c-type biogenesis protein [Phaeobacter sp.]|uniref:cytochrome c-type biogenesis protein n=1 Tax=Phaeobacter sp. TaxID=1902409 RepID=UPI0025E877F6|nr:cytochrome c-type biogenesis protein [Phaeobacter sp.]
MIRKTLSSLVLAATVGFVALPHPVFAVQPDEILEDPALEARARLLSKDLRCLVCRNESIDESNADLARDLRLLVRERLVAGDSDEEAMAFIVDRYGEYVLLNPKVTGANWLLYAAGPGMLLLALMMAGFYLRGRSAAAEQEAAAGDALTAQEKAQLDRILKD